MVMGRMRAAAAALAVAAAGIGTASCGDEPVAGGSDAATDAGTAADGAKIAETTIGCPAGSTGCHQGERWVCNEKGTGFVAQPCATGTTCLDGQCVECSATQACAAGLACVAGKCQSTPLAVLTQALPPALVGIAYKAALEASGGTLPYAWTLSQGKLLEGLTLATSGVLDGSAKATGSHSFQVQVEDAQKQKATAVLVLDVKDGGLVVTTTSPLKAAVEGEPYKVTLAAQGGTPPYFWGIVKGQLPTGLALGSDGSLAGTATSDAPQTFDVKVLDNSAPTLTATKTFDLPVKLAPLQVVGAQELNLFIAKVIVLPLIIVVDKVPVPYTAKLEAKGGKKPYTWQEVPLPGAVKNFLPKSGLPQGLTVTKDGAVSGSVTDASLVLEFKVPLSQLTLKGFFFSAEVKDSQASPQAKTALFIIPTVPVGGP
ncbi:MAG: hypothetical protein EXR79_07895 [Myxococcales bacterium]|nr:hypothetical protein [Myxococcales bacterium]